MTTYIVVAVAIHDGFSIDLAGLEVGEVLPIVVKEPHQQWQILGAVVWAVTSHVVVPDSVGELAVELYSQHAGITIDEHPAAGGSPANHARENVESTWWEIVVC